jgi:hypothetical protein
MQVLLFILCLRRIHNKLSDMNQSLNKVRSIESEVRKLDPNFQFPMRGVFYPRVGG